MVLDQIVRVIEGGGIEDLLKEGLAPEVIDSMRHRPARDLIQLAEIPSMNVDVLLEEQAIASNLTRLDLRRRDARLLDYFVANGAAIQLVCNLFALSMPEVRNLRAQLLPPEEQASTRQMPPPEERDRIHSRWCRIRKTSPNAALREWLYQLHQAFPDYRIDALCRTLNEFSEASAFPTTGFNPLSS
jgi:hypothetical protein